MNNIKRLKKTKGFIFIFPSLVGFSILYVIPYIWGIKYSVSRSGFDKTFVGLANYKEVLDSKAFVLAAKNTVSFMGFAIPLIIIISLVLSIAIYETKAPKLIKLLIILPVAVPSASVVGFYRKLLGTGAFNLMDSEYAMLGVILIFIWKNTGYNLIIYLAGLTQIEKSIGEAAEVDGANYIQRLWHVILPLLTPTTVFVGIVTIVNSFKVFKDVYILQGSYPNLKIYMLQHYMNNKFADLQYESLTSAAYIFSLIILIFASILYLFDRRFSEKVGDSQ
ncbi:carbohydrate ABC transporter permease [Brassicibacter mesophilus]|uniref:carbohydrate ABC transporter permease n=1 Tax=Brassicibacter mesophilus TaxID=745119 RepID=UPI003D1CAF72